MNTGLLDPFPNTFEEEDDDNDDFCKSGGWVFNFDGGISSFNEYMRGEVDDEEEVIVISGENKVSDSSKVLVGKGMFGQKVLEPLYERRRRRRKARTEVGNEKIKERITLFILWNECNLRDN